MKIETKPWAAGLLAALLYLVAATVVLSVGCVPLRQVPRTTRGQYEAAVRIDVVCITEKGGYMAGGSGVIVDSRHVLTAAHVAADDGFCAFDVTAFDGSRRSMYVKTRLPGVDLASLEISTGVEPFTLPDMAFGPRPDIGERVCAATALPRFSHKCGEVEPYEKPPGDISLMMIVDHGNSGSGLYDERGQLIGIVIALVQCSNGQYCEGRAASLEGHIEDLLK
jgi:S1-C subfamily serine protease